jgi:hypothetical protein
MTNFTHKVNGQNYRNQFLFAYSAYFAVSSALFRFSRLQHTRNEFRAPLVVALPRCVLASLRVGVE